MGMATEANGANYKTASGELFPYHGGLCVQATTKYGHGVTFRGRKADVRETLISSCKVHSKGHVAVVDSQRGFIIPRNSTLARMIQQIVPSEIANEPGAARLFLENGTYIGNN